MIRVDLAAAKIPYETAQGVIDFHALRATFVSHLVASGASVKTCQVLARHSTPSLTIGLYAKASLHDIKGAVESLPDLTATPPRREALRATGTGDSALRAITGATVENEESPNPFGDSPLGEETKGLKILRGVTPVWVRFPPPAIPQEPELPRIDPQNPAVASLSSA